MGKARTGFTYLDTHSSEFDIRMTSCQTPPPEIKEIKDSVPHMDGDYDFTFMNGAARYNNRQITVGCFILCERSENLAQVEREIIAWLYGKPYSDLYLDHQEGYVYKAKCTDINFDDPEYDLRKLTFTLTFEAKPYAYNFIEDKEVI